MIKRETHGGGPQELLFSTLAISVDAIHQVKPPLWPVFREPRKTLELLRQPFTTVSMFQIVPNAIVLSAQGPLIITCIYADGVMILPSKHILFETRDDT